MSANKAKGTRAETWLVNYLTRRGFNYAERRALRGNKDCGDIAGIPGVVIEVKNASRVDLAGWLKEARVEALNADVPVYFVVAKANGKGEDSVGEWYAVTSVRVMCDLLADELPATEAAS